MMFGASFLLAALFLGVALASPLLGERAAAVSLYPDPPKIKGDFFFVHDPSLVQRKTDGKYFLYTTHDKGGIITADNLTGPWKKVGSIVPNNSTIDLPGRNDIWAPDVAYYEGTYYGYYSVSTFGSQNSAIGLVTSKTMEPGSWTDHGTVLRSYTGDPYNAIDPHFSIDERGKPLLSFGSFWSDIFQFELTKDLKSNASVPVQISFNSTAPQAQEGAFIWKHEQYFYLFVSSGYCCGFDPTALPAPGDEYKVFVGRSKSAHGPFVDSKGIDMLNNGGDVVLASHGDYYAPGGQAIFTDYNRKTKTSRDVFVYHYVPVVSPDGYNDTYSTLGLNGIDWRTGWPVLTEL